MFDIIDIYGKITGWTYLDIFLGLESNQNIGEKGGKLPDNCLRDSSISYKTL